MDDFLRVRDRQGLRDLPRDPHDPRQRQSLRRQLTQCRSFDELHRDVAIRADNARFVNSDDVGVVQRRGERRFAQQAIESGLVVNRAAADDFQRNLPAKP